MILFYGIGYSDIESLYNQNKLSALYLVIYGLAIVFSLFVTIYKFGKQIKEDTIDKPITLSAIYKLLLPFLPYYLLLFAMPILSGMFETMTNLIVNSVSNAVPSGDFSDLDQPIKDYLKGKLEAVGNITILGVDTGITDPFEKFSIWIEEFLLSLTVPFSHYLYAFSLTVYFLWLMVLESFAPLAVLGIVFKEFTNFTTSYVKNIIANKLFLIFLALSNLMSIGIYTIYKNGVTSNILNPLDIKAVKSLGMIIIFILLKAFLYKKSFDLANKII